jgi:hypothetical protein
MDQPNQDGVLFDKRALAELSRLQIGRWGPWAGDPPTKTFSARCDSAEMPWLRAVSADDPTLAWVTPAPAEAMDAAGADHHHDWAQGRRWVLLWLPRLQGLPTDQQVMALANIVQFARLACHSRRVSTGSGGTGYRPPAFCAGPKVLSRPR